MALKRGEMTCFGRLGVLRYMMLCEPYFIKFAEEKFSCILWVAKSRSPKYSIRKPTAKLLRSGLACLGNFVAWAGDSSGYLRKCRDCGQIIYIKFDADGQWRPYASWIAGDAAVGEWILHKCPWAIKEAGTLSSTQQIQKKEGDGDDGLPF